MMQFTVPPTPPPAIHAPVVRSRALPPATQAPQRPAQPAAAVHCAIVGDSIGVGIAAVVRGCAAVATKSLGSRAISMRTPDVAGGSVVISAGSNDPDNPALEANLEVIRARTGAARVVWIAPYHPRAAAMVARVAARHGDAVVRLAAFPSRDRVHPASYPTLAAAVTSRLRG